MWSWVKRAAAKTAWFVLWLLFIILFVLVVLPVFAVAAAVFTVTDMRGWQPKRKAKKLFDYAIYVAVHIVFIFLMLFVIIGGFFLMVSWLMPFFPPGMAEAMPVELYLGVQMDLEGFFEEVFLPGLFVAILLPVLSTLLVLAGSWVVYLLSPEQFDAALEVASLIAC